MTEHHPLLALAFDPGPALGIAVALCAYAAGVRRLARRGRPWSAGRGGAFGAGLLVVAVATQSGLAEAESELFSAHVVQHVLLGMVAPLLLTLGAPITLALQTSTGTTAKSLRHLVHSRPIRVLTHPGVAAILFSVTLFGLYLTPLFELSLRNELVDAAVHLHFLAVGSVLFWAVLGTDAVRHQLGHGIRLLIILLLVPFHAVVGVAILTTRELLAGGWYARVPGATEATALTDQHLGGGLLWITGDLLGLVAAGLVLSQWMGHDERQAEREDRRLTAQPAQP